VRGRRLEVERIDGDARRPTLVFLHEGLGSVSLWKDFPASVAAATGCPAVVYSRYGYGQSDLLEAPFAVDYMHREALETLPDLLATLAIRRPVLVGHSDGASIALIHAGSRDDLTGLVALAPHVFVEDISVRSIAEAKVAFETTDLPQKLARHHADVRRTFLGWNDIWLHPDFRRWNIEAFLPAIRCPVLAIQGADDEYGTMAQVEAIERRVGGRCEVVKLEACGHSPHRDQPELTLAAIERFVATL
jgi:pimeloyl-ACP methyl ester carboxylesterase